MHAITQSQQCSAIGDGTVGRRPAISISTIVLSLQPPDAMRALDSLAVLRRQPEEETCFPRCDLWFHILLFLHPPRPR